MPSCVVLAVAAAGCSAAAPPSDPSGVPASFALERDDFPAGYAFYDDRDLRALDVLELGPAAVATDKAAPLPGASDRGRLLAEYSKLTLDHLRIGQPPCDALSELGRRPAYHAASGPLAQASADSRSSLGFDQRASTTLAFVVTRAPFPLDQHRQSLAGCGRLAVTSEKIGQGHGSMSPVDAPDGGFGYDLEAELQSPAGVSYRFSRVFLAERIGQNAVLGSVSRTASAEAGERPLDQSALRAMLRKLADKVARG